MTNSQTGRDDHFEEVLGRLDALIRRGQPETEPLPPPAVSEASIPVLTEVYQPVSAVEAFSMHGDDEVLSHEFGVVLEEKLEQAVDAVLPIMVGVLEDALMLHVRPAMEEALGRAVVDLRQQTEALLRQRLQQALAREKGQAEM